ncbi:hypothetical protein MNBD_ALPHA01-1609 [hydrothermal vent metagenome]|uniref:Putative auto-transporter adhesin head GIN domain-containing protein n=1 Tax=hydrothermal vent metagenome TaxID=652676 RepID=A0A3B0T9R1_9ZZZZ
MTIFRPAIMAVVAIIITSPFAVAETRTMTLNKFSKVKVSARADLDISVGKPRSFSMEGRTEDLAKLIIKVKDDTLIIKKEKYSGAMKKISITIAMEDLTKFIINGSSNAKIRDVDSKSLIIGINGSGDVTFDGKSDELKVQINGSGDVVSKDFDAREISASINGSGDIGLAGKCQELKLQISGSGDFSGRELTCKMVKASISGSGDATVYAGESIHLSTSGSSDVNVYGNPKSIQNRSSGSSDFVVHDDK